MSKALARNPLSASIFTKTGNEADDDVDNSQKLEAGKQQLFSGPQNLASDMLVKQGAAPEVTFEKEGKRTTGEDGFLQEEQTEKVTFKLSVGINDWLDTLLRNGRRLHGSKIPKEIWVQAAIELLRAQPVDWSTIASKQELVSSIQKLVNGEGGRP